MLKKVIIFILILIIMIPVAYIGSRGIFTTGDIGSQYPYLFAGIGIASVFVIGLSYKTLFMKKEEKIKKELQVEDMKYYEEIAKLFEISIEEVKSNSKELTKENAIYFGQTFRGGASIIVDKKTGCYLRNNSATDFNSSLNDYIQGERNGDFNDNKEV